MKSNIALQLKDHYTTDDFKSPYADLLLSDRHAAAKRIKEWYTYQTKFQGPDDLTDGQIEALIDELQHNDQYIIDAYAIAWKPSYIDGVMFGEQEEDLTAFHNHRTDKPYTLPYLKKIFAQEGFYVSGIYAFLNLDYDGIAVDIETMDAETFNQIIVDFS